MTSYKHAATVSGQVYFCSSPIRLDSYNRCQFGCAYCFSRNRSQNTSLPGLRFANSDAFLKRLERVSRGEIQSAFDEFLLAKVPIQLGGMQDPFSPMEADHKVTLSLLRALDAFDYPTIISTKSVLASVEPYLSILKRMNVVVRFSAAGVSEASRPSLEIGCPAFVELLDAADILTQHGVPVSLRIQPVIPGCEDDALGMVELAARRGVQHVSFEYLKIGTEDRKETLEKISAALGRDIWRAMHERGLSPPLGRDYALAPRAKLGFLREARSTCRQAGVRFGAGDTEFIPMSDGVGCCNSSGLFLRAATQFRANFAGMVSGRDIGEEIRFSDLENEWQPTLNMHQYLNTESRGRAQDEQYTSWMGLLAHRWNGRNGPYSPEFFYGIEWTGNLDTNGFKIYRVHEQL